MNGQKPTPPKRYMCKPKLLIQHARTGSKDHPTRINGWRAISTLTRQCARAIAPCPWERHSSTTGTGVPAAWPGCFAHEGNGQPSTWRLPLSGPTRPVRPGSQRDSSLLGAWRVSSSRWGPSPTSCPSEQVSSRLSCAGPPALSRYEPSHP